MAARAPRKQREANGQALLQLLDNNEVDMAAVRALLDEKHIDVNWADMSKWGFGRRPLLCAIDRGHFEAVDMLLADDRVDLDAPDWNNCTPISYAADLGFVEVVEKLLARGVDVGVADTDGQIPLDLAKEKKHDEVAELLRTVMLRSDPDWEE